MQNASQIIMDTLTDSVADTLYLIPFLLVTYLLMEWLEHKTGDQAQESIRRAGAAGPIVGAVLGVVPQCGFSAAAATLYAGRVISLGTLFAVILSTSDEMLPIFVAAQVSPVSLAKILGAKIIIGMLMGFVVDAGLRMIRRDDEKFRIHELCEQDHCECVGDCEPCHENPELVYDHEHDEEHEHHHEHGSIWKSAVKHTLQVTVFVFLITIVLNGVLQVVGEETLGAWLSSNEALSVLGAGLVGLIPNCAASVAIAELYVEGMLSAGAMMSGLLMAGGVGLLVLVRANRKLHQNVIIIVSLYACSVFFGFVINALGIVF